MLLEILKSKIHSATVTDKHIQYEGSITVDESLMKAAGLRENEKAHVFNKNNGERFETYVIRGKSGSGVICVNGAAARKVETGDVVIIVSYCFMTPDETEGFAPKIIYMDDKNKIKKAGKSKNGKNA